MSYTNHEAWNCMSHSNLKVVGNPEYRCNNSSPRYMRENHYAILVFRLKISYVFKYKIRITLLLFLICLGKSFLNPIANILIFIDTLHNTANYNLNPLLFLGSSANIRKLCRNLSNCSLNHSPIGCLFMVSISLPLSIGCFSTLKTSFLISNLRLCSSE